MLIAGCLQAKEMAAGTEIDGRKIRVDYSITQRAHTPTPGVYLGRPFRWFSELYIFVDFIDKACHEVNLQMCNC